ncbi:MAG: alpha/beta hydrolase-fold protein [Pseudomonadota bacterium]
MLRLGFVAAALAIACAEPAPATAQTPAPEVSTPIVIGQSYRLASTLLGQDREINVWLPPGYGEAGRRYPVLYVLDGGQDQDFHHISGLVQLGTVNGTTRDIIVVGVATIDRRNELALRTSDPELVAAYPTQGESARFRSFLAEEVVPFVETQFATDGTSTLMGESLAGLFVVEALLKQPDLFDAYVAVSPSLWWDDGELAGQAGTLLRAHPNAGKTLILSLEGDRAETDPTIRSLVEGFNVSGPNGWTLILDPRPTETHATIYHGAALDAVRRLYPSPAE